ncbi:MAG: efflux RND transporter periplasmic adaptor subunit [Phycisphaerae bacterium]|nr:efflux RND transporter periplasmic adaptor subunit [Phycisphaerae bacterium]
MAQPRRNVVLAFSRPGIVAIMPVRRGVAVPAGQLLAGLNTSRQTLRMRIARLTAESTLKVQAAEAQLRHDQVDLRQTQWAFTQKAATAFELQRAKLKVTIARLSLALAKLKHQNDQLEYSLAQLAIRRRQIRAPFAGIVEIRYTHTGQSVNAFQKVLRLVQITAFKIDVPVPLSVAMKLRLGGPALVKFATGGTATGKIVDIARVADSASGTLLVRVQVANPSDLPAGQQVSVRFSAAEPAGASSRRQVPARATAKVSQASS